MEQPFKLISSFGVPTRSNGPRVGVLLCRIILVLPSSVIRAAAVVVVVVVAAAVKSPNSRTPLES